MSCVPWFTAHSSFSLPRLGTLSLPFLDQIFNPSASTCLFHQPLPRVALPCPLRALVSPRWIVTVGLLTGLPSSCSFTRMTEYVNQTRAYLPPGVPEVLSMPHPITPEGEDLVLLVGALLQRFHLGGTAAWS